MTKPDDSDQPADDERTSTPADHRPAESDRPEPAAPTEPAAPIEPAEPAESAAPEPAPAKPESPAEPTPPKKAAQKKAAPKTPPKTAPKTAPKTGPKPIAAKPPTTPASTRKPLASRRSGTAGSSRDAAATPRGAAAAPRTVRWGFRVIVVSAVVGVLSLAIPLLNQEALVNAVLELNEDLTRAEAEQQVTSSLWMFLAINVMFGVLLVLSAYKAREGLRRSRMMLTIVTVILVLFHYLLVPTLYGQLAGMIAAIGTALMYTPATREFYPPRQTTR